MSGEEFEKKCKREQGRGNVDVSEDTNRGIYSKASSSINNMDYPWMSKIDLEQVTLNLMKTKKHVSTYCSSQKRVMISITEEACDWGGKVKLHKYSEWYYINYLKNLDRRWIEMKVLEKYASEMDLYKFYFALESLHSLFYGHLRTACGTIIPNIRYPVFFSRPALS